MNDKEIRSKENLGKVEGENQKSNGITGDNRRSSGKNAGGSGSLPRPQGRRRQRQKCRRALALEAKKSDRKKNLIAQAESLRALAGSV